MSLSQLMQVLALGSAMTLLFIWALKPWFQPLLARLWLRLTGGSLQMMGIRRRAPQKEGGDA